MGISVTRPQRTLRRPAGLSGVGLHSGAPVKLRVLPAPVDAGVRFRRTDVRDRNPEVLARWDCVSDTLLCTTLANEDGVKVATVEHLMAALAGCGVDNAVVELDGPEVPVADGSAEPFVAAIQRAGVIEQPAALRFVQVLKRVEARDGGGAWCALEPSESFAIRFEIDFASRAVGPGKGAFELGEPGAFRAELARARTFGFERDVEKMRQMGLARGGSLANAVVIGEDDRVLNPEGLRFVDECLRHKALDAVGDLALAGAPVLGRLTAVRSGHALNNRLLRTLFADASAWRLATSARRSQAPASRRPREEALAASA